MDPHSTRPIGRRKPLDEAVDEYSMACEVESKSPRTVQAYNETLLVFRRLVMSAELPDIVNDFAAAPVPPVPRGWRIDPRLPKYQGGHGLTYIPDH